MTSFDESIIAVWTVAGQTYQQLYDDAVSDAQLFMEGVTQNPPWHLIVINCQPRRIFDDMGNQVGASIHDGQVTDWEGTAVIKWIVVA